MSACEACEHIELRLLTYTGRPIGSVDVSIEAGARENFTTCGAGFLRYPTGKLGGNGTITLEYKSGDRHVAWKGPLPTETGSYSIALDIWVNEEFVNG